MKNHSETAASVEEMALLGCILVRHEQLAEVQTILTEEDFASDKHRLLYRACLQAQDVEVSEGKPFAVQVWNRIVQNGDKPLIDYEFIGMLGDTAPVISAAAHHARKIKRFSQVRAIRRICQSIESRAGLMEDLSSDEFAQACGQLYREMTLAARKGTIPIARELLERIEMNPSASRNDQDRMLTGIHEIDSQSDIFQRRTLTIIGARPAMGKSTFMRQLIRKNIERHPLLCFTMEESSQMFLDKCLCSEAGISYNTFIRGYSTEDQRSKRLVAMGGALSSENLRISDDSLSAEDVAAHARSLKYFGFKPRAIFLDHFQHMAHKRDRGENDAQMFGRSALTLTNLAKELDTSVVLLVQLNRRCEEREEPRPYMSDIRDTGSLEQLASNILFLWTKDAAEPERFLYLAKQRNGISFEAKVNFFMELGKFESMMKGRNV